MILGESQSALPVQVFTTAGFLKPGIFGRGTEVKIIFRSSRIGFSTDYFAVPLSDLPDELRDKNGLEATELDWQSLELREPAATEEHRAAFPAALEAYAELGLSGPDALELPGRAPDPASAVRLTVAQVTAALRRARRRGDLQQRARDIQAALRAPHLSQPAVIAEAYAASVQAAAAVITVLNEQIKIMEAKVSELFRRHPDAGVYLSQPGIGDITGARILGEFGDAPGRYASAKARKNYAGTSPLTIQSGKAKTVHARYIRNQHLIDALHAQALSSLTASPGARAFYDELRAREADHEDALRRVASRLTGILHGCLRHGCHYDETTAWAHRAGIPDAA